MRGIQSGIQVSRPVGLTPLLCVQHLILLGDGVERGGVVDVHRHLVALTLLGGDDDHTIGGTASVDRGRRGIFQHLYRLDVGSVQRVEVLGGSHTVDDEQRSNTIDRAHTTHADRGTATTGSSIGDNVHAGQLTLHRVQHVGVALTLGALHIHHGHSTRQVGLTLGLVTSDHHLGQLGGVVFHRHLHAGSGSYFLLLETNIREDKCFSSLHFQFEVSVEVGDCTVGCAFLHNRSTDNGLAGHIDHGTSNLCLRVHQGTGKDEHEAQKIPF